MAALILAMLLAKVLMTDTLAQEAERQAQPVIVQPAPIYVKTIRMEGTAPQEARRPEVDA